MTQSLASRLSLALGLGRILATRTDRGQGRQTLTAQIQYEDAREVRDDTPILTIYGVRSRPRPGADAAVAFLGGNRGAGVVIATDDGRFGTPIEEGEVGLETHEGTLIRLKMGKIIEMHAPGGFTLTGGPITHNGRNIGATHRHTGVQAGIATTGEPQP